MSCVQTPNGLAVNMGYLAYLWTVFSAKLPKLRSLYCNYTCTVPLPSCLLLTYDPYRNQIAPPGPYLSIVCLCVRDPWQNLAQSVPVLRIRNRIDTYWFWLAGLVTGSRKAKINHNWKSEGISCLEVLYVIFLGLKASPVALTSFMEAISDHKKISSKPS